MVMPWPVRSSKASRAVARVFVVALLDTASLPALAADASAPALLGDRQPAERVSVGAGISGGAGVLVLDWPRPVVFAAAIEGDRLILRFARPFEARFAPAVAALSGFLAAGGLYPDRRTAGFALARRDLALRATQDGTRVTVELFPLSPDKPPEVGARPAPLPPPPEPRAGERAAAPVESARALLADGKPGLALAAVAGERGGEAERLRLDAHWRRGDWQAALGSARKLLESLDPAVGLSAAGQRLVLDAAVAATLARDRAALEFLDASFGPAMQGTAYRDPFNLLAKIGAQRDPVESARRAVEAALGLQRFLAQRPLPGLAQVTD